jgi:hypothetical protein
MITLTGPPGPAADAGGAPSLSSLKPVGALFAPGNYLCPANHNPPAKLNSM